MTLTALGAELLTFQAARAVACPRCHARPGEGCTSTGGGNHAFVATHRARESRVEGFTPDRVDAAVALLREVRRVWPVPSERFAVFEAAAVPIPANPAKQPTPKGVRLSEPQAEEIERAAARGGVAHASTAHFHGDAAHRQTVQALEGKGILAYVETTTDGYDRVYRLTAFGWRVYREHRLIIRRLPEDVVAAAEAATARLEADPGLARVCAECDPAGYGPPCTAHFIAADVEFERSQDV